MSVIHAWLKPASASVARPFFFAKNRPGKLTIQRLNKWRQGAHWQFLFLVTSPYQILNSNDVDVPGYSTVFSFSLRRCWCYSLLIREGSISREMRRLRRPPLCLFDVGLTSELLRLLFLKVSWVYCRHGSFWTETRTSRSVLVLCECRAFCETKKNQPSFNLRRYEDRCIVASVYKRLVERWRRILVNPTRFKLRWKGAADE